MTKRTGSQLSFQGVFPNLTTTNTFKERRLNDLIDDIRGRKSKHKCFDPLLLLGDDLMHEILLYVIDPQRIAGSRAWETEFTRGRTNGPLVLTNISRRWNRFITSSPLLWSYLHIDTGDDDGLEYLQLFLLLSCNTRLFIALHGRAVVSDTIVTALLRAGDRISAFLYPPNVSRSTLAKFGLCQEPAHNRIEPSCSWYKLEVDSVTQSSQTNHYSFPTSIHSLSIDVPLSLSKIVMLSPFRSLSSLSAKISLDRGLSPGSDSRLELPNLEGLSLEVAIRSDQQVEMPIFIICRMLKILNLRLKYTLELDFKNPQEERTSRLKFDVVDMLQELHIHLAIRVVTGDDFIAEWLKEREQWEQQQQRFMLPIQKRWRQWLNIPDNLENVRRSSLEVTSSMKEKAYAFIRKTVEETLLLVLPQLMELTTSEILHTFPKHLKILRLHVLGIPDRWFPIKLPSLVSLEIQAGTLDHLLIMQYIQVPQLRDLQVQVQDGLGKRDVYDWRNTTGNLLDRISLTVKIPHHQQGNPVIVFHLPRTHFLNVSSPHIPLCLYTTEPAPFSYTLHAILGATSGPKPIISNSVEWQENLITEWINPHNEIPIFGIFESLVSLRRIILDQNEYLLFKQAPIDELLKLLAENIYICPHLTAITAAECPSSWPTFLCHLRRRNLEAMLSKSTKCIEELSFSQPIHAIIIRWLMDAVKAKIFNVTEWPPVREGNAWLMRPFTFKGAKRVLRSCYICHITGMELGCLMYETRRVNCGRERGDGSRIASL